MPSQPCRAANILGVVSLKVNWAIGSMPEGGSSFRPCVAPLSTGQLLIERSAVYVYLKLEVGSRGNVNVARPTRLAKPVITLRADTARHI